MRSGYLPRKLLVQLILIVLHVNFINASKLDFYQDVEPERPLDINYEQISRYLEAQKQSNMRENIHRSRITPNLPWPYDEYLDYRRQKEKKILEALLENPSIFDVLENRKLSKERDEIHRQLPARYEIREDLTRAIDEPEEIPYSNIDPVSDRFNGYTNVNIPYPKNIFRNEKPYYVHGSSFPSRLSSPENENYPIDDISNERLMKLEGKLMEMNENKGNLNEDRSSQISEQEPEFTFKFEPPKIDEHNTFAIKPNDPRYYENEASTESVAIVKQTTENHEKIIEKSHEIVKDNVPNEEKPEMNIERATEDIGNDKFSIMKIVMPEPHRRAEPDNSVVVSSSHMMSNDIYFIAIVAGCSAAAMFALVLISLTWCRLQRGAKAAADIEYPAYGVTGPNKDISPSGDQRLAHSAQMYHFQHQKQQIIAMENRTAASRDPGSVSEAESDEENEEGDYTVYECPGLASTGEMEVKNPLFHDDPTPATPPQIHKEEDHM